MIPYPSAGRLVFLTAGALILGACSTAAGPSAVTATKFRVQEVTDPQNGGLVVFRHAIPQDWKADDRLEWKMSDLYTPVRAYSRAEAPDGSAWLETYPVELFYWLDARWDNFKKGSGEIGGIHET
ncbi:MAG: hypothetical protein ABI995_08610, partial [Acidobacteriota bacterium]